ncbi:hypothetical protein [Nocardioides sp.]|uniref:hypothetical protein n=1 Tax=Nocardioides sp. TaxID=35761 RepID=UPI003527399A
MGFILPQPPIRTSSRRGNSSPPAVVSSVTRSTPGGEMRSASTAAGMVVGLLLAACTAAAPTGPDRVVDSSAPPRTAKPSHDVSRCAATGRLGPDGSGAGWASSGARDRRIVWRTVGRCTAFYLARYGDGSGLGPHGYFTRGRGLSIIHGQDRMHTPQGIRRGSRARAVTHSFAHLVGTDGFMTAPASDDAAYFFIVRDKRVAYFGLSLPADPCLNTWMRQLRRDPA